MSAQEIIVFSGDLSVEEINVCSGEYCLLRRVVSLDEVSRLLRGAVCSGELSAHESNACVGASTLAIRASTLAIRASTLATDIRSTMTYE